MRRQVQGLVLAIVCGNLLLLVAASTFLTLATDLRVAVHGVWTCLCFLVPALAGLADAGLASMGRRAVAWRFEVKARSNELRPAWGGAPAGQAEPGNARTDVLQSLASEAQAESRVERPPRVIQARLMTALMGMSMRYHSGLSLARIPCVNAGLCTQQYWNLAFHVLNQIGLYDAEQKRYLTRGADALDIKWMRDRVRVFNDVVMVWPPSSQSFEEIDLTRFRL